MRYSNLLLSILIVLTASKYGQTSLAVYNENQFQPEVYSFPKPVESGIDHGGDLNLSIPILTVTRSKWFGLSSQFFLQK
jgi:hypothetical protein